MMVHISLCWMNIKVSRKFHWQVILYVYSQIQTRCLSLPNILASLLHLSLSFTVKITLHKVINTVTNYGLSVMFSTIGIHIYVCTRAHILILHESTFMRVWARQHVRSNRYAMSGISILIVSQPQHLNMIGWNIIEWIKNNRIIHTARKK